MADKTLKFNNIKLFRLSISNNNIDKRYCQSHFPNVLHIPEIRKYLLTFIILIGKKYYQFGLIKM
ncbi:MAG: hypothetical protein C4548_16730 [Desulfobacteraceae bacterium]|nr:MAG: hypothetical protein C4548_16730 [Desulfobacteraceae bacterium]